MLIHLNKKDLVKNLKLFLEIACKSNNKQMTKIIITAIIKENKEFCVDFFQFNINQHFINKKNSLFNILYNNKYIL